MKKAYHLGTVEKHRLDISVYWYLGLVVLKLDGVTILKKPFLFRIRETFPVGRGEKHLIQFEFNVFDYLRDVLHVSVDGQKMTHEHEILSEDRVDTAADIAAATFLFMVATNIIFSVIGTVFVPYLDSLQVRVLLLAGAFLYLFFALQFLLAHKTASLLGVIFFIADSIFFMFHQFSWGGLLVRLVMLAYLLSGLSYLQKVKLKNVYITPEQN